MKRALLSVVAVLLATPAALTADEVAHRYLVGTRGKPRPVANEELPGRAVDTFEIVDAFVADLTPSEAATLSKSPRVRYIEPDGERHIFVAPSRQTSSELRSLTSQTTPYGVNLVNASALWSVKRGDTINVAVLDTGIDLTHADLKAAYAGGFNAYAGGTETVEPKDDEGHGTHVSGTIAATDNDFGVVGVAPKVRLWVGRVLRSDGKGSATGSISNIVKGIDWAVQQKQSLGGNWIISMSLGSCSDSTTERAAIDRAVSAGVLVIAAAGNHDSSQPDVCDSTTNNSYAVSYPAAYPGVLAIAAVDSTSKIADFSNVGSQVALAGPGVDVLSTMRTGTGSISFVSATGHANVSAVPLTGSPNGTVTGKLVDCGLGRDATEFPAAVSGNIALIKRGDVNFSTKARNAKAAGATAVVVYNKDDSALNFTLLADTSDNTFSFPLTIAISQKDGESLLAGGLTTTTIANRADDYGNLSGTSMAAPHVAAVAALVWSVAPEKTADQVKQALIATARDLGDKGTDTLYGNGLVDAYGAARLLAPNAFVVPGRRTLKRGQ